MQYIITEIRRRNVLRVAGVYGVIAWLLVQLATVLETKFFLSQSLDHMVFMVALAGLPIALAAAWTLEMTPDGIRPYGTNDMIGQRESDEGGADLVMAGAFGLLACFVAADIAVPDRAVPLSEIALQDADRQLVTDELVVELPALIDTADASEQSVIEDLPTGSVTPAVD